MDKRDQPIGFGDRVHYFIPGHGSPGGYSYVAGEMSYSDEGSHVLLVTEKEVGMPIHSGHCTVVSRGHDAAGQPLRDRYLERWPEALKTS